MTQTGMSLGTPAYMSPEQAMGERDIGARSDVYALGAMTYEMLTGEPPFTGLNSQAIVAKVLTETPPPLRPKRPTVSPAVEHAVLTALQKLPADRFGTAKDFADALDGTGKGASYAATAVTSRPRALAPFAPARPRPARRGRPGPDRDRGRAWREGRSLSSAPFPSPASSCSPPPARRSPSPLPASPPTSPSHPMAGRCSTPQAMGAEAATGRSISGTSTS